MGLLNFSEETMAKYCPIIKGKALYLDCQECEDKVCKGEKDMNKCSAYFVSSDFIFYTADLDGHEASSEKGSKFFSVIKNIKMHKESDMKQFLESSLKHYDEFRDMDKFLFEDNPTLYFAGGKTEKFFNMNTDNFGVDTVIIKNMHEKILRIKLCDTYPEPVIKLRPGQSVRLLNGTILPDNLSLKNYDEDFLEPLKNMGIGFANKVMDYLVSEELRETEGEKILEDINDFTKFCIDDFIIKSNIIDMRFLEPSDLIKLGFTKWDDDRVSNEEARGIYLVPVWLWQALYDGTEVISVNGRKAVKGIDSFTMTTRYSMLPWGIKPY